MIVVLIFLGICVVLYILSFRYLLTRADHHHLDRVFYRGIARLVSEEASGRDIEPIPSTQSLAQHELQTWQERLDGRQERAERTNTVSNPEIAIVAGDGTVTLTISTADKHVAVELPSYVAGSLARLLMGAAGWEEPKDLPTALRLRQELDRYGLDPKTSLDGLLQHIYGNVEDLLVAVHEAE